MIWSSAILRTLRRRSLLARAGTMGGAVLLVLTSLLSATARAAEPAKAEELIRRGVELRHQGQDTRALPFFQKAYELSPSPRTAAQLGLVEMALGYQLDSERHLAEGLSSSHDIWIRKNRTVLEDSIAKVRQAIGEIAIRGPAGAEVFINGKSVGRLPLAKPVRVGEGPNIVELRSQGSASPRRSIQVMGGKTEEVALELPAEETRPPAFVPRESTGPRPVAPSGAGGAVDRSERPDGSGKLRVAAWATAVGAAAFVGFGIVETASWMSRKRDFEQHVGPKLDNPNDVGINCGADDPQHGGAGCDDLYQKMQGPRTLAIVGYGVGAALAVGSAVLFWTSASPSSEESHALACTPVWSPRGLNAQCRVTF